MKIFFKIIISLCLLFVSVMEIMAYDWKNDTWDRGTHNAFVQWYNDKYRNFQPHIDPQTLQPNERIDEVLSETVLINEAQGKTITQNYNKIKQLESEVNKLKNKTAYLLSLNIITGIILLIGAFMYIRSKQ